MTVSNIQSVATTQATIQSNRKVWSIIVDVALSALKKIKEAFAACMDAFVAFKAKVTGLLRPAHNQQLSEAPVSSINTQTSNLDERAAVGPINRKRANSFSAITSNSPTQRPQLRRSLSEGNLRDATVSSINPPTLIPNRHAAATIIQKNFRVHRSRVANPVKSENASLAPVKAAVIPENTVNQSKNLKYGTAALAVVAAATGAVLLKQNPEALNQILKDSKVLAGLALETGTRLSDTVVDGVFSGVKVAGEVARKIVAENFPNIQPIKGGFAYNFRS